MLQAQQILQDRYQLQQQLGRTAAGRLTWLATDLQSNERVTVKLLAFSPQMQWEELKLFEREAQVLQELNHPRIPRYRDYLSIDRVTGDGVPWFGLVQDYIAGYSLQELLERGKRFTEKQVREIAVEVLQILIYLHELSPPVLHRDLKPSNLIVGEDRKIYLIDFGAVQAQAAVTGVTFTVVGTSGYAPLEQFWGRAVAASDLYALGSTLIHLLTGVAPADLPQKDSRIQFSDRVSLNPSFVSWIEKMTEIALEKRFSQARQALDALQSGKSCSNAVETEISPVRKLSKPTMRKLAQPTNSRIQLETSATEMEVQIPTAAWLRLRSDTGLAGLTISIYILLLCIIYLVVEVPVSGLLLFFLLSLMFLAYLNEKIHVHLKRDRFHINRKMFRLTYDHKWDVTENIAGVFLHHKGASSKISIQVYTKQERLVTYFLANALTHHEAAWLVQEIQDWLHDR